MKRTRRNKPKHTPIPGLANYIVYFNSKRQLKQELAAIRAAFADKVYAASIPERSQIEKSTSVSAPDLNGCGARCS